MKAGRKWGGACLPDSVMIPDVYSPGSLTGLLLLDLVNWCALAQSSVENLQAICWSCSHLWLPPTYLGLWYGLGGIRSTCHSL